MKNSAKLSQDQIDEMASTLKIDFQPNFNLGADILLTEDVSLAFGLFTDLSSVPAGQDDADQVHMFGGSVALGLLGKQVRGWFGLSFEYGQAVTKVFSGDFDLDSIFQSGFEWNTDSTISRWSLAGVIGSSYSFFRDKDEDKSKPKPNAKPEN